MKVSQKLIEDVVSESVGEDTLTLVYALQDKKNISEFKLANEIGLEVKTTRNMLYRLYNSNLVTFIRKKDKQKGWYIYYWTFNTKRIKQLTEQIKQKKIERLSERLIREKENQFFACSSKCVRVDFEQATNFNFKCIECGQLLHLEDNTEKIK